MHTATKLATSPPVSPYKRQFCKIQRTLPPIQTLPSWNRSQLGVKKPMHTIQTNEKIQLENSIKLELLERISHIESGTQTSPLPSPKSSRGSSKTHSPGTSAHMRYGFEKKIAFLQTSHTTILSNLHQEIDTLKQENKALQFRLIMSSGDSDVLSSLVDQNKADNQSLISDNSVDQQKIIELQQQVKSLQISLNEEKDKNKQLMDLVNEQKKRSISARNTNVERKEVAKRNRENNLKARYFPRTTSVRGMQSADHVINKSFDEKIKKLKQLTNKQQEDLQHLKDKIQLEGEGITSKKSGTFLPKLVNTSRIQSGPMKPATSTGALNTLSEVKGKPLSLPILRQRPPNESCAFRQKKTKPSLRQPSNKDLRLT